MMRTEPNILPRRPRLLLVLTALLALFQTGAVFRVLQIPGDLTAQITLSLPLELIASAIWAFLASLVCIALWKRQKGAGQKAIWLLTAFVIYNLLRLIVFTQADYDRGRLGFLLVSLIAIFIAIRSFLFYKRHSTESIEQ